MSDMGELAELIRQYDFINEERWGIDDEAPPTWEEVRDKHLSHWRRKDMTFEFWSTYMQSSIIEAARAVCRRHIPSKAHPNQIPNINERGRE